MYCHLWGTRCILAQFLARLLEAATQFMSAKMCFWFVPFSTCLLPMKGNLYCDHFWHIEWYVSVQCCQLKELYGNNHYLYITLKTALNNGKRVICFCLLPVTISCVVCYSCLPLFLFTIILVYVYMWFLRSVILVNCYSCWPNLLRTTVHDDSTSCCSCVTGVVCQLDPWNSRHHWQTEPIWRLLQEREGQKVGCSETSFLPLPLHWFKILMCLLSLL